VLGILADHAEFFIVVSIAWGAVTGFWFLFAAYNCDTSLARWMLLFPPLALLIVIRYPETCLRPFLFNLIGWILLGFGIFLSFVSAARDNDLSAPSAISN
jgi:hypothetical protein